MTGRGAYGIALRGPLAQHTALRDLAEPKVVLDLSEAKAGRGGPDAVSAGHVRVRLAEGSELDARDNGDGTYAAELMGGPSRTHDDLVHPYLAPIAALIHRWRGVPALHGAAVASKAGVVALIGERGRGKTTTAAALAHGGDLVLISDDLIVVEDGQVLPGPLSLDVRPEATALLEGDVGKSVRGGERRRRLVAPLLDPSSCSLELRVIVHLAWGDKTVVRSLPAAQRLQILSKQLYWPTVGSGSPDLLALVAVPQVVLERPPGRAGLDQAVQGIRALMG